jgi:outer membrane PBP1 activator LpoA protein
MKANKKISPCLILSVLTLLLAGCQTFEEPVEVVLKPESNPQQSNATLKRFQDAPPKGQTAIDSAIELSKKNTEFFEQMTVLQQDNLRLTAENARMKDRIAVIEPELKQAKKELNEANDLLIEMRIELNNWKTDILGFRNETRDADKAQLEALLRILEVLGGEVQLDPEEAEQTELPQEQDQNLTTVPPNKQSEQQAKQVNISGKPNE